MKRLSLWQRFVAWLAADLIKSYQATLHSEAERWALKFKTAEAIRDNWQNAHEQLKAQVESLYAELWPLVSDARRAELMRVMGFPWGAGSPLGAPAPEAKPRERRRIHVQNFLWRFRTEYEAELVHSVVAQVFTAVNTQCDMVERRKLTVVQATTQQEMDPTYLLDSVGHGGPDLVGTWKVHGRYGFAGALQAWPRLIPCVRAYHHEYLDGTPVGENDE